MAKHTIRPRVGRETARLVEDFARRWGKETTRAVPPEVVAHARASIREGLLAMAGAWEQTLLAIEARARELRRALERREPRASRSRRPSKTR